MSEILKTKNYEMFRKHENNCALDPLNLRKIISSITVRNLLEMRPILVDGYMRVIDGQHRLEAAKALGVEIYYQIKQEATHEDIVLLNTNQRLWSRSQYLEYHVSLGNIHYKKLADFCKRRDVTINEALSIIRSETRKQPRGAFSMGGFKFPDGDEIEQIEENLDKIEYVFNQLERYLIKEKYVMTSLKAKIALLKLFSNPDCSAATLVKKMSYKMDSIHQKATVQGYYEMFKEIYNWKAKTNVFADGDN